MCNKIIKLCIIQSYFAENKARYLLYVLCVHYEYA